MLIIIKLIFQNQGGLFFHMQQTQQMSLQTSIFTENNSETNTRETTRVLAIVADSSISQGLEAALPAHFRCLSLTSGRAALELVGDWKPDIIVIDTHVSDMLYDALCAQLHSIRYMVLVPIIILSNKRGLFEKYLCMQAGASDYIKMPVTSNALANHVMLTLNA